MAAKSSIQCTCWLRRTLAHANLGFIECLPSAKSDYDALDKRNEFSGTDVPDEPGSGSLGSLSRSRRPASIGAV
jgi:hypothetical protein